jgi:tetratricopeptide (TPR) repeat protein
MSACAQNAPRNDQALAAHRAKLKQYYEQKNQSGMIEEFRAILNLTPDDYETRANLGVMLYFKGDCAGAIPELKQALDGHEGLWRQTALLGFCEERTGDAVNAIKDIETAYPHLEEARLKRQAADTLLHLYSRDHDLGKAAALIASLRESNPTDVGLLYEAYQIYTDLASEAMIALSLVDPDSPQMHMIMANEALRYGDRATALRHLKKVIELNPQIAEAHYRLAEVLNSSDEGGDKNEAEREYKKSIELNPQDEVSECRLGELAAARGDLEASLNYYLKAAAISPDDPVANIGLAKAYAAMKQPQKAASLLEAVIRRDPTDAIAHFRLSTVYRQMGRYDDAKRELEAYKKYKQMKDKLGGIYHDLRLNQKQQEDAGPDDKK